MRYMNTKNPDEYVGDIVYITHTPKKLYVISGYKYADDLNKDVIFELEDEKGEKTNRSFLVLKPIDELISDTERKLENHKARLTDFKSKRNLK